MHLYRYFVSQSSEFCRHNPLCFFLTSVYCCLFRYRLSPETSGYTIVCFTALTREVLGWMYSLHCWVSQFRNSLGRAHQNSPGLGAVNRMLAICHAEGTLTNATRRIALSCHQPNSPSALVHASAFTDILRASSGVWNKLSGR